MSSEERYAESGLEDLACTHECPSADTLLYRLKKLERDDAYLMPAIKNDRIRRVIKEHHNGFVPAMVKLSISNAFAQQAFFGLTIYSKKEARETGLVHERCIVFATNLRYEDALRLFLEIPEEYGKRWRIETGYRVRNQVKAKTTSTNFTVRLVYPLLTLRRPGHAVEQNT